MLPVRSIYVPHFGSQLGSSQKDETQPDQTPAQLPSRIKRGNKRGNVSDEKTRLFLKVKLQRVNNSTLSNTRPEKTKTKQWMKEDATNKTQSTVIGGGAGTNSDSIVRDVFSFSQRPTSRELNEKEKAKLAVLRTISKMLEENQLIRQRLAAV
ncbi:hypothetical protein CgunFtcFv8_017875 [Champsocephalus gunnari]|uniref:Uncharacterized protein n=1 Tax=Champsocephalus gunnari TaxID=52237 RepID=A0AAN8HVV5_CHAGU|nr:hypothetical protein CgunFtcFv8_017875 [Champsocephalus gunnari]